MERSGRPKGESTSEIASKRARVEQITSQIEQKSENAPMPRLHFSDFGLEKLTKLEAKLEDAKLINQPIVVAVVRCFDKQPAAIQQFCERIRTMKDKLPDLAGVFMSIDQERDAGVTEKSLMQEGDTGIPVVPMEIENYTWTSGLNAGVAMLNELCLEKNLNRDQVRVMNMSFDVSLTPNELEHIQTLLGKKQRFIFTVRLDGEQNDDLLPKTADERFAELKTILKNPSDNVHKLVPFSRNTLAIVPLKDVIDLGGYNPNCNQYLGMEDHDFWMRLTLGSLKKGPSVLRSLKDSFADPITYTDNAWNAMAPEEKNTKFANEVTALTQISAGNVATGLDSGNVPKAMQDFVLRQS